MVSQGRRRPAGCLLAHAAERRSKVVALHPRSHLAVDEVGALDRRAGLTGAGVGKDHRHFSVEDLAKLAEPLAAVTLELPLRQSGVPGAAVGRPGGDRPGGPATTTPRFIWTAHGSGRSSRWMVGRSLKIAALAYSVDAPLRSRARRHRRPRRMVTEADRGRQAVADALRGDLPLAFPMIVTALDGLANSLPRMAGYHRHALALAEAYPPVTVAVAFRRSRNPPHLQSLRGPLPGGGVGVGAGGARPRRRRPEPGCLAAWSRVSCRSPAGRGHRRRGRAWTRSGRRGAGDDGTASPRQRVSWRLYHRRSGSHSASSRVHRPRAVQVFPAIIRRSGGSGEARGPFSSPRASAARLRAAPRLRPDRLA